MKVKKIILWVVLGLLLGIQFVPSMSNQSQVVPKTDFMLVNDVPNKITTILKESCYDCHSNNTRYPWYNNIQPIAWFLENHIKKGKEELNFNNFGNYSKRRQSSKLKATIDQIKDNEMPLSSYTLIHGEAKLSIMEKESLMNYMTTLMDSLK